MFQRTSVGLDVHARSVMACGLDRETGELFERRLCPDHDEIREWIRGLPQPVAATYEAGPTGFGLARALNAGGIRCLVAAPSKLIRPSGDRVKTDARDARHLARLLHLGQIVEVSVPSAAQEAARDLVRAREDCRADLMRTRHRLSKLLLRQGRLYCEGKAWTATHERWLRRQRFDETGLSLTYQEAFDAMLVARDRRDRLDAAITTIAADSQFTPGGHAVELPARSRHADWVRVGRRDRRLAPIQWAIDRRLPRISAQRALLWGDPQPRRADQDRQRTCPPAAGGSRLAPPQTVSTGRGVTAALGSRQPRCPRPRASREPTPTRPLGTLRCPPKTSRGSQRRDRPGTGRLVLVTGHTRRVTGQQTSR